MNKELNKELKVLCPYCNTEWNVKMMTDLSFSEGSYTPGCVGSKIYGTIDIYCDNCKKLVYRKEIEQQTDYLEWEHEETNNTE